MFSGTFICCSVGSAVIRMHIQHLLLCGEVLNLPLDLLSPCGLCFQPCSRRRARRGQLREQLVRRVRTPARLAEEALPIVSVDGSSDASGDDGLHQQSYIGFGVYASDYVECQLYDMPHGSLHDERDRFTSAALRGASTNASAASVPW